MVPGLFFWNKVSFGGHKPQESCLHMHISSDSFFADEPIEQLFLQAMCFQSSLWLAVRVSIRPLKRILYDAVSLYLVEEFQ